MNSSSGRGRASEIEWDVFKAMIGSREWRDLQAAFHIATGLSVRLEPPGEIAPGRSRDPTENAFCALMRRHAAGRRACSEIQRRIQQRLGRKLAPQGFECFAGMVELAVPVLLNGEHVATLLGGHVFRNKPSHRQFSRLGRQLQEWGITRDLCALRRTYYQTPVRSEEQIAGALALLRVIARDLAASGRRHLLRRERKESPLVAAVRSYLAAHAGERLSLRQVAENVHLSRHYFCKRFKQAAGMTLTEFVARARVESAKQLLANPNSRINEVFDRAGFNSISQFNRTFRHVTGKSPTAYRRLLRQQVEANEHPSNLA